MAIVRIHNDVVGVLDQGHIDMLMLLDLSAAVDTVDHEVIYQVLSHLLGVIDEALDWIEFPPRS